MGMVKRMSTNMMIKVYKAINTVLHRITMKREFALIAKSAGIAQCDEDILNHIFLVDKSGLIIYNPWHERNKSSRTFRLLFRRKTCDRKDRGTAFERRKGAYLRLAHPQQDGYGRYCIQGRKDNTLAG